MSFHGALHNKVQRPTLLRFWAFGRKPRQVLHVEHNDPVDVWRVLSSERDLPAWLRDLPETPGGEPAA